MLCLTFAVSILCFTPGNVAGKLAPAAKSLEERPPLVDQPKILNFPADDSRFNPRDSAFSPDGKILVFADKKDRLVVWDIGSWKEAKRLSPGSATYDASQVFSGDGKILAVWGQNNTVRLLESGTWRTHKEIKVKYDNTTDCHFHLSHDGNVVAVAAADNKTWVWNVKKGTTKLLSGHSTKLRCCAVAPGGRLILSGSGEEGSLHHPSRYPAELKFWEPETGKELFSGSGSQGQIFEIVFSPEGKRILLLGDKSNMRVWDVERRQELFALEPKRCRTRGAFSPDGKWILTSDFFGEIEIWEVSTGRLVKTVKSGIRIVTSASFSPDGQKVLLYDNDDKRVKLLMLTVPTKK